MRYTQLHVQRIQNSLTKQTEAKCPPKLKKKKISTKGNR